MIEETKDLYMFIKRLNTFLAVVLKNEVSIIFLMTSSLTLKII